MARKLIKPKQTPPPEPSKDFDENPIDSDSLEDEAPTPEPEASPQGGKLRDWRDVERYKEMRRLRRLVDDELDLDFSPGPDAASRRRGS